MLTVNKLEEFEGIVNEIIYTNEENGYTVAEFLTLDETITIVGILPYIYEGENLKVMGNFTNHQDYGEQFKVEYYIKNMPKTKSSIYAFLSSGIIRGIRCATAKKIVDKFGEKTLDIIEENPGLLSQIKGISYDKALQIGESYKEKKSVTDIIMFLQKYNISINLSMKISKVLGNSPINKIEDNPYILCEKIDGISFLTADSIASQMGFLKNNVKRIKAGVKYVFHKGALNGHTYLNEELIVSYCESQLNVSETEILNALFTLVTEGEIIKEVKDEALYYLPLYYMAENDIANKLLFMNITKSKNLFYERVYDDIYSLNNITLADKQKDAVKKVLSNKITVITGGPGTGKTTVINSIISIFEKLGKKVTLTAPTGRAAKRMAQICNKEAKTIHRLLEVTFNNGLSNDKFVKCEKNPIYTDVLIVDEMSMVDVLIFNSLLKAVKNTTRLVLVGDINQLPSVGAGNVLKDIINSDKFNCVYLDEIYRQEKESMIVNNAHGILKGEYPETSGKNSDYFMIKKSETQDIISEIISLCKDRLPNYFEGKKELSIQVLSPMKKTHLGTISLNNILQNELNPPSKYKKEKQWGKYILREGDKIIQTRNNYDIPWQTPWGEKGIGVFNGDTGIIKEINNKEKYIVIEFYDGKIAEYEFSNLEDIDLAYAITVHKSQGSEFDAIIIPSYYGPKNLMYRNLFYTALTRAKSLVVVVGSENVVKLMIDNNIEAKRLTSLKDKIINNKIFGAE
ncbi:MAG: ATP-dependent RecD-like DNA helicase [Ruminococcaceae bacterium]|nr:ATP-dependent RecD-like DNA helicase [Oscillospiraceae bacterium]